MKINGNFEGLSIKNHIPDYDAIRLKIATWELVMNALDAQRRTGSVNLTVINSEKEVGFELVNTGSAINFQELRTLAAKLIREHKLRKLNRETLSFAKDAVFEIEIVNKDFKEAEIQALLDNSIEYTQSDLDKLNDMNLLWIYGLTTKTQEGDSIEVIGGEGKGLTNVKSEIERLNGTIKIERKDDETIVTVLFPKADAAMKVSRKVGLASVFLLSSLLIACSLALPNTSALNDKDISLVGHRHAVLNGEVFSFYNDFVFKERTGSEKQQLLKKEQLILSGNAETDKEYREDLHLLSEWLKKHKNSPGGIVIGKEATPYELESDLKLMPEVYPKIKKVLEYLGENDVEERAKNIMLYIFGPGSYAQYFNLGGKGIKVVGLEGSKPKEKGMEIRNELLEKLQELVSSMNLDLTNLDSYDPDSLPDNIKIIRKFLGDVTFKEGINTQVAVKEIKGKLKLSEEQERILEEIIDKKNELLRNAKERNAAIVHNIEALSEHDILLVIGALHIDDLWGLFSYYNIKPVILKNSLSHTSNVMISEPGGIDFNAANLNLQIKRDGKGVPLPISQQNLENIHIDGLIPVIIEIKPAAASSLLSELQVSGG